MSRPHGPLSDPAAWEGVDWAVGTRVLSTGFGVLNALLMLFTLKTGQLGFFLVANNLLMIYQIADLGGSGFLTTRTSARGGLDPASRAWAALLGAAGPFLFMPMLFLAGLHFLNTQAQQTVTPALWLLIVASQALAQSVLPFISLADGMGLHRKAWRRMFGLELISGLALALGLATGSARTALVIASIARGLLFPLALKGLLDAGGLPALLGALRTARRASLAVWKAEALRFQATFFWINGTGFIPLRLVVPLVYQFQGPRQGAVVGIAMQMAGAAHNIATGFSLGALGRLSVAYGTGRLREFQALLRRVSLAAHAGGASLLLLAAAFIEAARHVPWSPVTTRLPEVSVYAPLFVAHFLLISATCPAVALRSTGRDTSAALVGVLGLACVPCYRAAAGRPQVYAVPLAMALLAGASLLVFLFHWSRRRAALDGTLIATKSRLEV